MPKLIENRSEILFIYDVTDANPNGDPLDENKPRIDEETGVNIVTDVRLKRTIRDYLINFKNKAKEVFIKEIVKEDGKQKSREERIEEEKINSIKDAEKLIEKYIDIRLFGATIGLGKKKDEEKGSSITWTGPVQFKFGRSLHKVDLTFIKGTTVMPSKEGLSQGTFTEKYILPYSLIVFYGVINENVAKNQNLKLTEDDISLMFEGIWNGTKNLISGSKFGHVPRFLMQVVYKKEKNYYIGELDKRIQLRSGKSDKAIRSISDVKIEISDLINVLEQNKDNIDEIKIKHDSYVIFVKEGKEVNVKQCIKGVNIKDFNF